MPPAYLYLILYPLCTLSLSASLSTTSSPIPTHPHRLSPSLPLQSLSLSLVGCLPLSGKQLFRSAQPTLPIHWIFLVFSHSTSIAALHLVASLYPIIFLFNSGTLCAHSTLLAATTWMIMPPDHQHSCQPFFISCLSPTSCLHLQTGPSVFCKQAEIHLSVTLHLLLVLTATESAMKMFP